MFRLLCSTLVLSVVMQAAPIEKTEIGISRGKDGSLVYTANKKGDKLCDFSFAGYEAGLKSPPTDLKTIVTINPLGDKKDDTAQVQAAIDKVSTAPLTNGFRGIVKLSKGTFIINGSLNIKANGVVLKGDNTVLNGRGGEMRSLLSLGGSGKITTKKHYTITDSYIPVGSKVVHVSETKGLSIGMRVLISRDVTETWIKSLGMNKLVRDGKPQTWIKNGATLDIEREIIKISDNTVTLDIPLCDSIDARFFEKIKLSPISETGRSNHIGVEGISFITNPPKTEVGAPSMTAIELLSIEDAWIRNCVFTDFMTGIDGSANTRCVTIQDNRMIRNSVIPGSAKPFDIIISGSQILVQGGSSVSKTVVFAVATSGSSSTFGPNAIIGYKLENENTKIEPHMRWGATGLLVQNVSGAGSIEIINRESCGTGHGWTGANSVVWNAECQTIVENPPGYQNFVFGGKHPTGSGTLMPGQSFDLYEAQLAERKKSRSAN